MWRLLRGISQNVPSVHDVHQLLQRRTRNADGHWEHSVRWSCTRKLPMILLEELMLFITYLIISSINFQSL